MRSAFRKLLDSIDKSASDNPLYKLLIWVGLLWAFCGFGGLILLAISNVVL